MYCQECGAKLLDKARECDICGHPIKTNSGRGSAIAFMLIIFILITAVVVQVRQKPAEMAVVESSSGVNSDRAIDTSQKTTDKITLDVSAMMAQVNPPDGYQLSVTYGDLGPQLLVAGAIDYDRFVQTYERAGRPLTDSQLAALSQGSDESILINQENAHFLLNFFWAVGLTNQNPLLTEGMMTRQSQGDIGRYASTGGWTIGQKPATELYSSAQLIVLTPDQQRLVESVAEKVYRPCCNNHTAFPDCNHGMAMLGLLELMAAQGATEDEMFAAAKYMNAFWFPQQALEAAVFLKTAMDLDFADTDGRLVVGPELFSATGFQQMHHWLAEGGELPQGPQGGNSCGV